MAKKNKTDEVSRLRDNWLAGWLYLPLRRIWLTSCHNLDNVVIRRHLGCDILLAGCMGRRCIGEGIGLPWRRRRTSWHYPASTVDGSDDDGKARSGNETTWNSFWTFDGSSLVSVFFSSFFRFTLVLIYWSLSLLSDICQDTDYQYSPSSSICPYCTNGLVHMAIKFAV